MKVCGLQFDIAWEDPETNFLHARELARRAASQGARLIVLPEMFATGFSMDTDKTVPWAGATEDFLVGLARELDVGVIGGFAAMGERKPVNVAVGVSPGGEVLARFKKLHPFTLANEQDYFEAGNELASFELDGVRIGLFICYDLRFPEPFRIQAPEVDLFCVIAHWAKKRMTAFRTLLKARAIENQAYVLGVNRVGVAQDWDHDGSSSLFDPFGERMSQAIGPEALIMGEVMHEEVKKARERFSFLSDSRPDLYRALQMEPEDLGE